MRSVEEIKQAALKRGVILDKSEEYYIGIRAKWFVAAQCRANKQGEKRAVESGGRFTPAPITYFQWGGLYQLDRGNGRQWVVPLHVFESVKFFANAYNVEVIRKRRQVELVEPEA